MDMGEFLDGLYRLLLSVSGEPSRGIRCRIGLHDFSWPEHRTPWSLWEDIYIECHRGCGARTVKRCYPDIHWSQNHPSPEPNDD